MVSSINGVSNIPFSASALDKITPELLQSPGMYNGNGVTSAQSAPKAKKKGGFFSFVGKLIRDAVIVAGLALAARKLIPAINKVDLTEALPENAKILEKAKFAVAKAGEWVDVKIVKKAMEFLNIAFVKKVDTSKISPKMIIDARV